MNIFLGYFEKLTIKLCAKFYEKFKEKYAYISEEFGSYQLQFENIVMILCRFYFPQRI